MNKAANEVSRSRSPGVPFKDRSDWIEGGRPGFWTYRTFSVVPIGKAFSVYGGSCRPLATNLTLYQAKSYAEEHSDEE